MKQALLSGGADTIDAAIARDLACEGWQVARRWEGASDAGTASVPDALVLNTGSDPRDPLSLKEPGPSQDAWQMRWASVGRPLTQAMIGERRGRVVLVTAALHLIGSVRPLALELAPHAVTVNAVVHAASSSPEEIAHVVRYLCSDEAGYVTAQTIRVGC